jgi:cysteine desulfurase / selenocysteine lyase
MIDPMQIRKDFPQLDGVEHHYLDSAASSLTPQSVLDAEIDYYTNFRANVHRGIFKQAARATELYEAARVKVAEFIGASPGEIIFTSGATESSNMLVRMLDESIHFPRMGKEVVTTVMEHHAALLPLQQYVLRRDLPLHVIPLDRVSGVGLDYAQGDALITKHTGIVSIVLASNVTGEINDVARLARRAKEVGALVIVDATAAVGHLPVNVKALGCDALYFSGHKMFAPTGIGVLWVREDLLAQLSPSIFGGHMIARMEEGKPEWADIPSRFEAGTKNISGVIGLGAAIDYLNALPLSDVHPYLAELVASAIAKLDAIPGVTVVAERDPAKNVGIVSFHATWAHPHDIAEVLARGNVAVRPGHHCAIPLHDALGIESTVRASFHVYNTQADIDALVAGLIETKRIFE